MGPTSTTTIFFPSPHFAKFTKEFKNHLIFPIGPIYSHNIEEFFKNYIVKFILSPNMAKSNNW